MIRDMMSNPQPHIRRKRCFFSSFNPPCNSQQRVVRYSSSAELRPRRGEFILSPCHISFGGTVTNAGCCEIPMNPCCAHKAGPDNLWVTDADSSNSTNFHVMLEVWVFYFFLAGTWGGSRDTNSHPLLFLIMLTFFFFFLICDFCEIKWNTLWQVILPAGIFTALRVHIWQVNMFILAWS